MLQALQYKTDQQSELRKIEGLNNRFFALTSQGPGAAGEKPTPLLLCLPTNATLLQL